jgi:hypothetical protein
MMARLPEELCLHIASYVSAFNPPPSYASFALQPSEKIGYSSVQTLKNLSRVSKIWRRVTLPLVFKTLRIHPDIARYVFKNDALKAYLFANLYSLNERERALLREMQLTEEIDQDDDVAKCFGTVWNDANVFRVEKDDKVLRLFEYCWRFKVPSDFTYMLEFLSSHHLTHHVASLLIHTTVDTYAASEPLQRRNNSSGMVDMSPQSEKESVMVQLLWKPLFQELLGIERVVVAAPPSTMGYLTDVAENPFYATAWLGDIWAFEMKMHYLELRRGSMR